MVRRCVWIWALLCVGPYEIASCAELPELRTSDPRLQVSLFAEHPNLVTPTAVAVDAEGAVYVAESHTHFRPDRYQGPAADRILVFRDRDGDGRAEPPEVFHEGFTHVMDIEFHHSGKLYVATRMNIHRLEDQDRDGRAEKAVPIVLMETSGTYPHNGISGLSFDFAGQLNFGLGENLGHDYTLVGTDGRKFSGGGEGGSTYQVAADGSNLRRVSTGWWNPFGTCVDAFGRVFGTDNDPGAAPPCRLIQVFEHADYGYEYRYGRTGLHPLISWTGQMPGTIPMVAGTGEAPCAIVAYESDAFPEEYRGQLLVASWADHRVERYELRQSASSGLVTAQRKTLLESTGEFRPVGLAVAPDGALWISDWVSSSYQLHGQGRLWRVAPVEPPPPRQVPESDWDAIASPDRRVRERVARRLSDTNAGQEELRIVMTTHPDARARAVALQALAVLVGETHPFDSVAREDEDLRVRQQALREYLKRGGEPREWLSDATPVVLRAEALLHAGPRHNEGIASAARSDDPLLVHAAIVALRRLPQLAQQWSRPDDDPRLALAALLAMKRHPRLRDEYGAQHLGSYLQSMHPELQFAAIKWIADLQWTSYRSALAQQLQRDNLGFGTFLALSAALDRLDGKEPQDQPPAERLRELVLNPQVSPAVRRLALRLINPQEAELTVETLRQLAQEADLQLGLEAVQTLALHPSISERDEALWRLAGDVDRPVELRVAAVAGLAPQAGQHVERLLILADGAPTDLQAEILRSLVGEMLSPEAQRRLAQIEFADSLADAVRRLAGDERPPRPAVDDVSAWQALLQGPADREAGRRIFFGSKVGTCSRCHQVDGRGHAVGPDLTSIHRRLELLGEQGTPWLLETILQPSRQMAPEYTPWQIITVDGRQHVGLPRRKGGNAEAYLGLDGREFTLKKDQIEMHSEMATSIMPEGLLQLLTDQELRDLFAFLRSH